jgi:hypothetical protein
MTIADGAEVVGDVAQLRASQTQDTADTSAKIRSRRCVRRGYEEETVMRFVFP